MNPRAKIRMSPTEVGAFLAAQREVILCTMLLDGAIHAVTMWYGFVGDCVAFTAKTKSQKVQNLLRDDRLTLACWDGHEYASLRGVQVRGRAVQLRSPTEHRELLMSMHVRYGSPRPQRTADIAKVLRGRTSFIVAVDHIVSWDHRKLGDRDHGGIGGI